MICPICHKKEANRLVYNESGTLKAEGLVCDECFDYAVTLDWNDFCRVFINEPNRKCHHCGRSLNEIMSTLIVGCPYCYQEFSAQLNPLIDMLQRRGNR